MIAEATKTLAAIPFDWIDLRECAKLLPAHEPRPMSVILEDLERGGKIETRLAGNPPPPLSIFAPARAAWAAGAPRPARRRWLRW